MKVSSYGFGGYITLQGVASKKYICMNKRGKLQAKVRLSDVDVFYSFFTRINYMESKAAVTDLFLVNSISYFINSKK